MTTLKYIALGSVLAASLSTLAVAEDCLFSVKMGAGYQFGNLNAKAKNATTGAAIANGSLTKIASGSGLKSQIEFGYKVDDQMTVGLELNYDQLAKTLNSTQVTALSGIFAAVNTANNTDGLVTITSTTGVLKLPTLRLSANATFYPVVGERLSPYFKVGTGVARSNSSTTGLTPTADNATSPSATYSWLLQGGAGLEYAIKPDFASLYAEAMLNNGARSLLHTSASGSTTVNTYVTGTWLTSIAAGLKFYM